MHLTEKAYRGRQLDSLARKYSKAVMQHITKPENEKSLLRGETVHQADTRLSLESLKYLT